MFASAEPAALLREVVEGQLGAERPHEPGLAAGIYFDGRLVASLTRGEACLEHAVPIDTDTVFDLASVSKQMTATCALLLARDGVVDLDADVRDVVPELGLPDVTLRHCLHHTSGLNDYLDLSELAGEPLGAVVDTSDFLRCLSRMVTPVFEPGTDISYSNTGYVLVATVLARASGRSFGDLMAERVFRPLGMEGTRLHDALGVVVPHLAFSYSERPGGGFERHEMVEAQVGDGAVLTTLTDLQGWHGFLLDGRVLGGDVRDLLLTRSTLAGGHRNDYAMGIQHGRLGGAEAVMHGGSMYGYRSGLVAVPALGLGITVMANRSDLAASLIASRLGAGLAGGTQPEVVARRFDERLLGHWVAPAASSCVRLSQNGEDVQVDPGGIRLRPGELGWVDEYADTTLRVSGDTATLSDRMGRTRRLRRCNGQPPDARHLVGRYEMPDLGTRAQIRLEGADVVLELDHQRALKLEPVGTDDGTAVFMVDDEGSLTVRGDDPDVVLRLWDGKVVLRRITGGEDS